MEGTKKIIELSERGSSQSFRLVPEIRVFFSFLGNRAINRQWISIEHFQYVRGKQQINRSRTGLIRRKCSRAICRPCLGGSTAIGQINLGAEISRVIYCAAGRRFRRAITSLSFYKHFFFSAPGI